MARNYKLRRTLREAFLVGLACIYFLVLLGIGAGFWLVVIHFIIKFW